MRKDRLAIVFILGFLWLPAQAETYRDIGYFDTLGNVKERFPKALFQKQNPAWAQPSDVMYRITGDGMSGIIIIKFDDSRPRFKKLLEENSESQNKAIWEKMVNASDDEITVEWTRWIPDYPIPLQRFISKYGNPEKSAFSDEDMQPYRTWEKKGLVAFLTDDEKKVVRVDYFFTNQEARHAWLKKYRFVPDFLKEPTKATKK